MVVSNLPETGEVRRVMGEFKRVFLVVGHLCKTLTTAAVKHHPSNQIRFVDVDINKLFC
jgi:hypothetical protein